MVLPFLVSIIPAFSIKIWRRQDPAQVENTTLFRESGRPGRRPGFRRLAFHGSSSVGAKKGRAAPRTAPAEGNEGWSNNLREVKLCLRSGSSAVESAPQATPWLASAAAVRRRMATWRRCPISSAHLDSQGGTRTATTPAARSAVPGLGHRAGQKIDSGVRGRTLAGSGGEGRAKKGPQYEIENGPLFFRQAYGEWLQSSSFFVMIR